MAKKTKLKKPIDVTTYVTFLLDRTGSMERVKSSTIEGFNKYLDGLSDESDGGTVLFSLVQFDSQSLDKICVRVAPKLAPRLNNENYIPRASTPLRDAAYKTIKAVEASLGEAGTKKVDDTKVVIAIQTDGEENCSTEYTWDELHALIKEKTALDWQFVFLGASIDAYKQAATMGIHAYATMSYDSYDPRATSDSFSNTARNIRSFAAGVSQDTNYSVADKLMAKDIHAAKNDSRMGGKVSVTTPPAPPLVPPTVVRQKHKAVDDFSL